MNTCTRLTNQLLRSPSSDDSASEKAAKTAATLWLAAPAIIVCRSLWVYYNPSAR